MRSIEKVRIQCVLVQSTECAIILSEMDFNRAQRTHSILIESCNVTLYAFLYVCVKQLESTLCLDQGKIDSASEINPKCATNSEY